MLGQNYGLTHLDNSASFDYIFLFGWCMQWLLIKHLCAFGSYVLIFFLIPPIVFNPYNKISNKTVFFCLGCPYTNSYFSKASKPLIYFI